MENLINPGETEAQAQQRIAKAIKRIEARLAEPTRLEAALRDHTLKGYTPCPGWVFIARLNPAVYRAAQLQADTVSITNGTFALAPGAVHIHATGTGDVCVHYRDGSHRVLSSEHGTFRDEDVPCYCAVGTVLDKTLTPKVFADLVKSVEDEEAMMRAELQLYESYETIYELREAVRRLGKEPPAL